MFVTSLGEPEVRKTNPFKKMSFATQRFTARKESGTYRIAVLGGSSVRLIHDRWLDLAERLSQTVSGRYDRVEIINAGAISYGTHRIVRVLTEVLQYDIDLVLLYSAHNEFEEIEQLELASLNRVDLNRLMFRSAFVRFMRDRIVELTLVKLKRDQNRRILTGPEPIGGWKEGRQIHRAWLHEWTEEDLATRMSAYRTNLETMVRLTRERDIPIIIGTVPSNLVRPALPKSAESEFEVVRKRFAQERWAEGAELARAILRKVPGRHQSTDSENEIIRALAEEYRLPLADIEAGVIREEPHGVPGETLFSDHCHLQGRGNDILIESFERKIADIITSLR